MIKDEFVSHLKDVCKNKELFECCIKFFNLFHKQHKGEVYTKDDFEKLEIDGKVIEQDVVKHVFADKDTATADEIFVYLFKQNIKHLERYKFADSIPNYNGVAGDWYGFVDSYSQVLAIYDIDVTEFIRPKGITDEEWAEIQSSKENEYKKQTFEAELKAREDTKIARSEHIQHTINHEMNHVFELKTFENRKYIKYNSSETVCKRRDDGQYEVMVTNDREENTEEHANIANLRRMGMSALSETINEIYANILEDKFNVIEKPYFTSSKQHYINRCKLEGDCPYNVDYNIISLLEILGFKFYSKDSRFNTKNIIDKLKNLNLTSEQLSQTNDKYIKLMMKINKKPELQMLAFKMHQVLEKGTSYDTFASIMGSADEFRHIKDVKPESVHTDDFKVILQEMLINAIHNCIKENLRTINQDELADYFKKINEDLRTIDNFLLYPKYATKFYDIDDVTGSVKENYVPDMNFLNIKQFYLAHKECTHFKSFAELITFIEEESKKLDIYDEMTFLKDQDEYENIKRNLMSNHERALALKNDPNIPIDDGVEV